MLNTKQAANTGNANGRRHTHVLLTTNYSQLHQQPRLTIAQETVVPDDFTPFSRSGFWFQSVTCCPNTSS